MTAEELALRAARGETLTPDEMTELSKAMMADRRRIEALTTEVNQLKAKTSLLKGMVDQVFETSQSSRCIDTMREEVTSEGAKRDSYLYNAFEVRQLIYTYDNLRADHRALNEVYAKLSAHGNAAIGLQMLTRDIDSGNVHPFSFQDVAALLDVHRNAVVASLTRPVKKNVREVFQLLKAHPDAHFYGEEVRMVRQWGVDHERNANIVKSRLGRAFTDPVGYMDPRFDLMLSKVTKRQLLDGKALTAQAYQHAVFTRPDFLKIPETWTLCDDKTQFHAGEHFHTNPCDGTWWCGAHFSGLSGYQLMNILETALAELRLLHIHFPGGINNGN